MLLPKGLEAREKHGESELSSSLVRRSGCSSSRSPGGGYLYEWAFELGGPGGSWIAEHSGCSPARVKQPLLLTSYDDTRVDIVVVQALADSVSVKLGDGGGAAPVCSRFVLRSAPALGLSAPSGLHVIELDALLQGKVVERGPMSLHF